MQIMINGQIQSFENITHLAALIQSLSTKASLIIAELNGKIIKSDFWEKTPLKDGDKLELVTFVGGG